jgi:hypothetical protein
MMDFNKLPNDCLSLINDYVKPKIKPLFRFESGQTFIMNKDEFIRIHKAEYIQRQDKTKYIKLDCEYVNYARRVFDKCERLKLIIEIEFNDNFHKYNMELNLTDLNNLYEINNTNYIYCDNTQKANNIVITHKTHKYIDYEIYMTKYNCCYTKKSLLELHRLTRNAVGQYGGQILTKEKELFNKYVKLECEELYKYNNVCFNKDISVILQRIETKTYALLKINEDYRIREFEDTDSKFCECVKRNLTRA